MAKKPGTRAKKRKCTESWRASVPSITVIVTKEKDDPYGFAGGALLGPSSRMASGKPFTATVVANNQMRANGATADEAVSHLKALIRSQMFGTFVKVVDLDFNDLIVEEVMES
jgi:hypothetical protein